MVACVSVVFMVRLVTAHLFSVMVVFSSGVPCADSGPEAYMKALVVEEK